MARSDKRQHIMQAAERLFTSRQFHEVTTDDVAAAANVGKGTIYRYFQDKDDLLFQITASGFDELCELVERSVPGLPGAAGAGGAACPPCPASFIEQLTEVCRRIRRFFNHRRQLLRMMEEENGRIAWCEQALRQRWSEHRKKLASAVGALLARGMDDGEIERGLPAEVLAHFLLGMLRTQARDLGDAPESMREVDLVVGLFLNGVRTRSPSKRSRTAERLGQP